MPLHQHTLPAMREVMSPSLHTTVQPTADVLASGRRPRAAGRALHGHVVPAHVFGKIIKLSKGGVTS
eukprot:8238976-Pyramimonas_sp.AAC.1